MLLPSEMPTRKLVLWTVGLITLEWTFFKLAYPFPDFFSDSYSYINAARLHWDINIWPIGYSKFLALFHKITSSDSALVTFQFLALESAALYLYVILLEQFPSLGHCGKTVIYLFLFCNPMFFYISNYITADALFAALTICWFTELLQMLLKPVSLSRLTVQAIVVLLAFTIRYNAMYYPIVSAVAIGFSRMPIVQKCIGASFAFVILVPFYIYSGNAGKKLTGTRTVSVLSGWQLANNALYMRGQIEVDTTQWPNAECAALDSISRRFFRKVGPGFQDYLASYDGNYFIQHWHAPLKTYMLSTYKNDDLKAWANTGITFNQYGSYIIKAHPVEYVRYFMWPNTIHYFYPPLSYMKEYNQGSDSVWNEAVQWFHYSHTKIWVISKDLQSILLVIFPLLFLALNIFFLLGIGWFWGEKKNRSSHLSFNKAFVLTGTFVFFNALFSIGANGVVIRYEFFPMILLFTEDVLLYKKIAEQDKKSMTPNIPVQA